MNRLSSHGSSALRSGVRLDDKGFVRTGASILRPLETSLPGVLRNRRRALGIGQTCRRCGRRWRAVVAALHAFLAEAGDKDALTINGGRQ